MSFADNGDDVEDEKEHRWPNMTIVSLLEGGPWTYIVACCIEHDPVYIVREELLGRVVVATVLAVDDSVRDTRRSTTQRRSKHEVDWKMFMVYCDLFNPQR
jgi:hypothetical protein